MLGQQQNNAWRYFGYDGLGSLRQMTNAGGFVTHSATFEPYGGSLEDFGISSSLGFTGEMHDSTGLVYLRARYADPVTGTFLTRDPVIGVSGFSQTWNPYSYVRNNPINGVDPSGKFFPLLIGAAVIVGVAVGAWDLFVTQGYGVGGSQAGCLTDLQAIVSNALNNGDVERSVAMGAEAMLLSFLSGLAATAVGTATMTILTAVGSAMGLSGAWATAWGVMNVAVSSMAGGMTGRATGNVLTGQPVGQGVTDPGWLAFDMIAGWIGFKLMGGSFAQAGGAARPLPPAGAAAADDAMVGSRGCNSFSADTLVLTQDGLKPILEIEPGDEVIGYVETTGETGEYTVTDTIHHTDPTIVLLTIDDETLETTANHPFYTDEGVWVNAAELEVGEQVYSFSGDYGTVESVEVVTLSQEMYNLTVAEAHTFFVGEGSWLVHNQSLTDPSPYTEIMGNLITGRYGYLTHETHGILVGSGYQANHLNQDAAFKSKIPTNEGISVAAEGNLMFATDTSNLNWNSQHYMYHDYLERNFWDAYRKGGMLQGQKPFNIEYQAAIEDALRYAGYSDSEVSYLSKLARDQRLAYGLKDYDTVPEVPGRSTYRIRC